MRSGTAARTVASLAIVALIVDDCGGTSKKASPSTTATTAPSVSSTIHVKLAAAHQVGAGVTVDAGQLPAGIAATEQAATVPPTGGALTALSPTIQLSPSGPLPTRTTVTITLRAPAPADQVVVVATEETSAGPWTFMPATVTPNRTAATFTTSHFSLFSVLGYILSGAAQGFKTDFLNEINGGATTTIVPPTCQGGPQLTAGGYSLATGGSVKAPPLDACLSLAGSSPVLKVVNDRRYPLEIAHPGLTVVDRGSIDYSSLESLSHFASGGLTVVAPGDSVAFGASLQVEDSGAIETQLDGFGESLYALQTGIDTMLEILGSFGYGSTRSVIVASNDLLMVGACADSIGHGPAAMLAACFTPQELLKTFGPKAWLLIPIIIPGPIVSFFESEFTALISQFNNSDMYTIEVRRSAVALPEVGQNAQIAEQLQSLLDKAGVLSSITPLTACASVELFGAQLYLGNADVEVTHMSTAGCNPGPFATFFSIRNYAVVAQANGIDGGDQSAEWTHLTSLYPNFDPPQFGVGPTADLMAGNNFQVAREDWQQSAQAGGAGEGPYWSQGAQLLMSGLIANPGFLGAAQAVAELQQLASLPDAMMSSSQLGESEADTLALDSFFETPGLWGPGT
jgi:hypothetical protein